MTIHSFIIRCRKRKDNNRRNHSPHFQNKKIDPRQRETHAPAGPDERHFLYHAHSLGIIPGYEPNVFPHTHAACVPIPPVPINHHRKESCVQKRPPWSERSKWKGLFHPSVTDPQGTPMCSPSLRAAFLCVFWSSYRAGLLSGSRDVLLLFQCHLHRTAQR
jgi:hypothetical protein